MYAPLQVSPAIYTRDFIIVLQFDGQTHKNLKKSCWKPVEVKHFIATLFWLHIHHNKLLYIIISYYKCFLTSYYR